VSVRGRGPDMETALVGRVHVDIDLGERLGRSLDEETGPARARGGHDRGRDPTVRAGCETDALPAVVRDRGDVDLDRVPLGAGVDEYAGILVQADVVPRDEVAERGQEVDPEDSTSDDVREDLRLCGVVEDDARARLWSRRACRRDADAVL